jgi:hypothetical protein
LVACSNNTERPYRLPYANGVSVTIIADHEDHANPPEQMFDMRASQRDQVIVAAAPGWIREIEDSKGSTSNTNNYVWIEHPLDYCQPPESEPPSSGGFATECRSCPEGLRRCNEWTLYAHMRQNSVTATPPSGAGLSEGDWVAEGQAIAVEGDVGCQQFTPPSTRHLHFTVFVFEQDSLLAQPSDNGDYEDYADLHGRPERVPLFCTSTGLRLVDTWQSYTPGPC